MKQHLNLLFSKQGCLTLLDACCLDSSLLMSQASQCDFRFFPAIYTFSLPFLQDSLPSLVSFLLVLLIHVS